jgi:hypothetical protein
MEDRTKEQPVGRLGITKTWMMVWAVSTGIVTFICYSVRPYVPYENEFSVLVDTMNVISYVLIAGIPVFLSAGIVLGTPAARKHILAELKSGKTRTKVFLRCLFETYALVLMFGVAVTSALFLAPYFRGISFYDPAGTGFLIYFPSGLVAALAVSLLLASIGVFLVMVSDDVIISTTLGSAVTFGLATIVGYSPEAIWASVTRGIAMLSPSSIVRVFAGALSGYSPPIHGTSLSSYFGFNVTFGSILLALAILLLISLAGLLASIRIFKINTGHWSEIAEMRAKEGVWESEPEHQNVHARIRRSLKIRRAALVGFVTVVLILSAGGTAAYSSMVVEQTTVVFHQSPPGGEWIDLGEWYIFSCNVQPSRYGQRNILRYDCYLEDWGSAPEKVSVYYSMLNVSSSYFEALNETGRRSLCSYDNETEGNWGGFGGSWDLRYSYGPYTFTMEIVATENETLPGSMYFWIELLQRPW